MKNKNILLYIKKGDKKVLLSYPDEKDLLTLGGDMEIIENGFIMIKIVSTTPIVSNDNKVCST